MVNEDGDIDQEANCTPDLAALAAFRLTVTLL